jgi:hypothetical protein
MTNQWWQPFSEYSWPVMSFLLGGIDGFNPCAMWTLFILIGFLLSLKSSRQRWLIGSIFIFTSFAIYGAVLLVYLFGFKQIVVMLSSQIIGKLFIGVGILTTFIGGMMVLNARKKTLTCEVKSLEQRQSFIKKMEKIFEQKKLWVILPTIIGLAISVNILELLCSFAIPTAFTAILVSNDFSLWEQLTAILIYDIAYILDDLVVFTIAMMTLSLTVFSDKLIRVTNFISGLVLFLLGLILIFKSEWLALLTI